MEYIADLHLHSAYSRATSPKMNPIDLSEAAKVKGVNLIGTGDFTHPKHLDFLKQNLKQDTATGFYQYNGMDFVLTAEISLMYTQGGKGRRVHHLLFAPDFETVDQVNAELDKWGRRDYDGRPIFGKPSIDLVEMTQSISDKIEIIPAHCLLPKTPIHCNPQTKDIDKVKKGDIVYTHTGKKRKVKAVYSRPYIGKTYTIKPWYFSLGLTTTDEHPFFAINSYKNCSWINGKPQCSQKDTYKKTPFKKYKPEWIQAKNLKIGDVILYPRFRQIKDIQQLGTRKIVKQNLRNKKKVPAQIQIDADFCRLIGYYLAEGYSNRRDRIGFTFRETETENLNDIQHIIKNQFDLTPKTGKDNGLSKDLVYSSKELMQLFEHLCYSQNSKKNAITKKLNPIFMELPMAKQKELFRGWWRGDKGYTSSRELMNQMKVICLRMGIIPSVLVDSKDKHTRRGNHYYTTEKRLIKSNADNYSLSNIAFFGENLDLLKDPSFKKFKTKMKRRHGWIDENYAYLPIREIIEEEYTGPVFNLEVDIDNSYVSEFATVHNCWTPWFGIFGSNGGFDSIKECFQEKSKHIHAIETGLSSDPAMNWRLSNLDNIQLVSFSDNHSYWPWRLGSEVTVFEAKDLSYNNILHSIRTGEGLAETIEVDPSYGKYHVDGHRLCGVCLNPEESKKIGEVCPKCKKKLTVGVLSMIEQLADRPHGYTPKNAIPYKTLLPLAELIANLTGSGLATKKVMEPHDLLVSRHGTELNVLLNVPEEELKKTVHEKLVKAIMLNREGKISVKPGYDGVYGVPQFDFSLDSTQKQNIPQKTLNDF